jgi:hypothetical protein
MMNEGDTTVAEDELREFEVVPTPVEIVLRATSRINSVSVLHYSEISKNGSISGSMEPRHLLAYLRSLFPEKSDHSFDQAAPLTQRDLLRMHHAVSKSDDIVLTVRRHCILFQIDPVKALILADRLILFHEVHDQQLRATDNEQRIQLIENLQTLWQCATFGEDEFPMKRSISTTAIKSLQLQGGNTNNLPHGAKNIMQGFSSTSLEISTLDILLRFVMDNLVTVVQESINEVRRIHRLMTKTFFLPANVAEKIRRAKTQLVKYEKWIQSCHYRLQYLSEDDEEMALILLSSHRSFPSQSLTNLSIHQKPQKCEIVSSSTAASANATVTDLSFPALLDTQPSFAPIRTRSRSLSSSSLPTAAQSKDTGIICRNTNIHAINTPRNQFNTGKYTSLASSFPSIDTSEQETVSDIDRPPVTRERRISHGRDRHASPIMMDESSTLSFPHSPLFDSKSHIFSRNSFYNQHGSRAHQHQIATSTNAVEDLLELYIIELAAIAGRVKHHVGLIVNAEETIQLRLSTIENELLLANTNFMLLLCALSVGVYVTGVGGMNLNNDKLNIYPNSFGITAGGSAALIVIGFVVSKWYFDSTGILPTRVTKASHGILPLRRKHLLHYF